MTPVREVARGLATAGLVRIDAHQTCAVTQLTFRELCEISDLCRLLEPQAMREAAAVIDDATPSERLRRILAGLGYSSAPYVALAIRSRGFAQMEVANDQHDELLDALRQRDGDRSAALACSHVDLTVNTLRAARDMFGPSPQAKTEASPKGTADHALKSAHADHALLDGARI